MIGSGGAGVERCRGSADVAADGAGALLAGRFRILLLMVIMVSSVLGNEVWAKRSWGETERKRRTHSGKADLITTRDVEVWGNLLRDWTGNCEGAETPKG